VSKEYVIDINNHTYFGVDKHNCIALYASERISYRMIKGQYFRTYQIIFPLKQRVMDYMDLADELSKLSGWEDCDQPSFQPTISTRYFYPEHYINVRKGINSVEFDFYKQDIKFIVYADKLIKMFDNRLKLNVIGRPVNSFQTVIAGCTLKIETDVYELLERISTEIGVTWFPDKLEQVRIEYV
jgi:hypothetical protein